MQGTALIANKDIVWAPHPEFAGVCLAWLMRRAGGTPPLSCALVRIAPDATVAEHVHAHEDDILYVLQGSARMWIEGRGDVPLEAGTFVRIPAGTRHRPQGFEGDFLAFNIWAAAAEPERAEQAQPSTWRAS